MTRLPIEQFRLGLFENPYFDAAAATARIGTAANRAAGMDAQRRSVVLLRNEGGLLPLKPCAKVFAMGLKPEDLARYDYAVTNGAVAGAVVPTATAAIVIKVLVTNEVAGRYRSDDLALGGCALPATMPLIDPRTDKPQLTWGAQDPSVYEPTAPKQPGAEDACLDNRLIFGGAFP